MPKVLAFHANFKTGTDSVGKGDSSGHTVVISAKIHALKAHRTNIVAMIHILIYFAWFSGQNDVFARSMV